MPIKVPIKNSQIFQGNDFAVLSQFDKTNNPKHPIHKNICHIVNPKKKEGIA
jgi:hypothetical protein